MATPQQLRELTEALKHCVGWGAAPERLGVNRRVFKGLPGMPSLAGLQAVAAGTIIRNHIMKGIEQLSGSYELFGRSYPATTVAEALRLELAFEGHEWSAKRRRLEVITLLGTNHASGYWARPDGPEWNLLYFFAEHLADPSGHPSPQTSFESVTTSK